MKMSKFHKKSAIATPRNQKPNWFLALQFDNPDIIGQFFYSVTKVCDDFKSHLLCMYSLLSF